MRRMSRLGANPVMRSIGRHHAAESATPATYGGVLFRTAILLSVMFAFGALSFTAIVQRGEILGGVGFLIGAPIIGLISVIVATRSLNLSPYFSIVYAVCQGVFVGAISGIYTLAFGDGIVPTAILATIGVALAMLFLYRSGIIRVGPLFRKVMFVALIGLLFSGIILVPIFLFAAPFAVEHMMGIYTAIVVISVIVASLYLVIGFDDIQKVVAAGADRQYEWPLALSFVVTLVWLYIELLRLLAIISASRR